MKTDYAKTGKLYPKLDAYQGSEYFASSVQFKTCEGFKKFLEDKYNKPFTVEKAKED